MTIVSAALLSLTVLSSIGYVPPASASSTSGSWNPLVNCTPMVVPIEQILGDQTNSMGGATKSGSMFNPGITSPVGSAKRWLTPGPTPSGWVSSGPPCMVTNSNGQVVSEFVEIHHIQRTYLVNEDYAVQYDPVNGGGMYPTGLNISDTTFNAFTPGYTTCTASNTTGCMHTIHVEFDHDWKAAAYCGPRTACDPHLMAQLTPAEPSPNCQKSPPPSACFIDVQGFVYWDSQAASSDSASHSFSGWEIHPLTGWRISTTTPDYSLSVSPPSLTVLESQSASSTITVTSLNSFQGNVSLAASVQPLSNSSLPLPIATLSPSIVVVSNSGTATSALTLSTSASDIGDYAVTVYATGGNLTHSTILGVNIVDFGVNASPDSLTIPIDASGQSVLTLASINGFSGSIGLTATVTPASITAGLSPMNPSTSFSTSTVVLIQGDTRTATLTISTSLLTTPGTYTITVSAASGGVAHTTVINVTTTLL